MLPHRRLWARPALSGSLIRRSFSDKQRKHENAGLLRATRRSTNTVKKPVAESTVKYRYRSSQHGANLVSLWGDDLDTEKKPFVRFFDEVDARIDAKRGERTRPSSLESIFDSLDKADLIPRTKNTDKILSDEATGERRSIFDVFPVPTPETKDTNPNVFDDDAFVQYETMVQDILGNDKSVKLGDATNMKKWLLQDEKIMVYHLPMLDRMVMEGPVFSSRDGLGFQDELKLQRVDFMKALDLNQKDYDMAEKVLEKVARFCAKEGKSLALDVAWHKVKEAGMQLKQESLSTFLHVTSTYPSVLQNRSGPLSSIMDIIDPNRKGNEEEQEEPGVGATEKERQYIDITEEIAAFHDILYPPSEQSVTVRVKSLVRKGNARAAEELVETTKLDDLRLRTYHPILKLYLAQGDISSALRLLHRLKDTPSVVLDAETYVQIIAAVAENGFFHPDSPPVAGASELGYSPAKGPELLNQLATSLAEEVLEISSASAKRLHTAVTHAFMGSKSGWNLKPQHPLAALQEENYRAEADEVIASRVRIDHKTGICPRSGASQRLIYLESGQRDKLKEGLLELAQKEYDLFTKNRKLKKTEIIASEYLRRFASWLDDRPGRPFTLIVDGANVGYYLQNFDEGRFNYFQVKFMVEALEKMNESPLVVIPFKYSRPFYHIIKGNGQIKQVVTAEEKAILEELQAKGQLYIVPPNCLDDLFWMMASISEQIHSRNGLSLDVVAHDPMGRWPGTRPMLVSNDQLRDHKVELIEPRLFRRWYSSHIVNYNFTGFVGSECVDDEIGFSPADFFSREIQCNPSDGDGAAWHFPVIDWDENERFCIRIPSSIAKEEDGQAASSLE